MKKIILTLTGITVLFSCSPEQDIEKNATNITIDFKQIVNPDTVSAIASLNTKKSGLYRGVFVAEDGSNHGVITINAGNDNNINAVLEPVDGKNIGFIGTVSKTGKNVYNFESDINASFTLNLSNKDFPIVEEAYINGLTAQATIIKEYSTNRVSASLGTFIDDNDANFSGTWDLLSTSTRVIDVTIPGVPPQSVTVNNIDTVVICRDGGIMHSDATMEDVTPSMGCIAQGFPAGTQQPFFSGEQTLNVTIPPIPFPVPVEIDEYFVPIQTSQLGGATANWSFAFSKANGDVYYDTDCTVVTNGGGTFSYNGRTGTILKI